MAWKRLPPVKKVVQSGCLHAPAVTPAADMRMTIAVGFGSACVTRDGQYVYDEMDVERGDRKRWWTVRDAERAAAKDPRHDWRIVMHAPLVSRTYQRQAPKKWVLIESGMGFA